MGLKKFFKKAVSVVKKIAAPIARVASVLPGPVGAIARAVSTVSGIVSGIRGDRRSGSEDQVLPPALPVVAQAAAEAVYTPPAPATVQLRGSGGQMALPALVSGLVRSGGQMVSAALSRSGGVYRRRRRRKGISVNDLGRIAVMGKMLGRNHPAVMVAGLKMMGGRL